MKKPEENNGPDFAEYMWMAEEGAEEGLEQQIEEEMELIEQDFLEAMFDELLKEEEENESYYGPPDGEISANGYYSPGSAAKSNKTKSGYNSSSMQLPQIQSALNPDAKEFVPRFGQTASS